MRLETLLGFAGIIDGTRGWEPIRDLEVEGVAYDSRHVGTGDLFVAVRGSESDGHDYLEEVAAAGAVAAVVEHRVDTGLAQIEVDDTRWSMGPLSAAFWGNPSERLLSVGITGTNGKTTIMYLVRALLESDGRSTGSVGTVEYTIGGVEQAASHTTPESVDLQSMMARMLEAGDSAVVMEVSSHALALGRVEGLAFDVACFTNLGRDHLDFHPSMDEYFEVKKKLFTDYVKAGGTAVINVDDPVGARLASSLDLPVVTAGLAPGADVTAADLDVGAGGLRFELHYNGSSAGVNSPLLGAFNVQNLLVAAAVGSVVGIDPDGAVEALGSVLNIPGRMERLPAPDGVEIILDYAHKPDALKVALQACREVARGRVIVVFGCGGDRDRGKRPLMGRIAALGADVTFVTNDNPRSEDPDAIILEITSGVPEEADCRVEADRRKAIAAAVAEARDGDVVLVAGKGHEQYQIIGDERLPFDERGVVAGAIAVLGDGSRG